MRKILSLSYNDLPFYLKTCLLSLSKYPEDQVIEKDVLVLSWIAEGFITVETQPAGTSLQEIGENYFSELINRSLIQPAHKPVNWWSSPFDRYYTVNMGVEVPTCQVHDIVLELMNQLSVEEGFVTTLLSDGQEASTITSAAQKRKIRRLSLHNNSIESYASLEASREQLSKVTSLDIFGKVKSIPPLSSFRVLRILQVDDCTGLENNHLSDLGKLRHLKFLRLDGLKVMELPESIGELESLETLDIRGASSIISLPVSLGKLGKLVRLLAERVQLPDGVTLENMKSLQELVGIVLTLQAVSEIGKLREVKVLGFHIIDRGISSELIPMCLQMCPSLQVLLFLPSEFYLLDFMAQVPSGLQRFVSDDGCFFGETFPRWINPSLSCLSVLSITLHDVHVLPEHLEKLAELPSLRFLRLSVVHFNPKQESLVFPSSASAFQCLTEFQFDCLLMFLKFQHGDMPKLQRLHVSFNAFLTNRWFTTNTFDYGLENLHSLRHVVVRLGKRFPDEAQDAIMKETNDDPNHASLDISLDW